MAIDIKAHNKKVLEAQTASEDLIKAWHGEEAWEIYREHSPEMKRLTAMFGSLLIHEE